MTGVIHHYDKRDPSEALEKREEQTEGCPSCQWERGTSNKGRKVCDAGQPAYPNGGKSVCTGPLGYKPKTKKGNGRGRARNNGERGGAR